MNQRPAATIGIISLILLFLAGCGHGPDHSSDQGTGHGADQGTDQGTDHGADHGTDHGTDHGDAAHEPGVEGHGSEFQLTLNNGEKWPVDEHTRQSAARIAGLFSRSETIHTVDDARALAEALDAELDVLVQGCTMTGPAHDQLHVFLVALFPQVKALKEEAEVGDLQMVTEKTGRLLAAYEEHFE